jgi:hypothetical protein
MRGGCAEIHKRETEEEARISNTVKINNKKKKTEVKVNYKLWAIIFGIFIAAIVGLSIWASFHWGVGMGTIGVRPVNPEDAAAGATEAAVEYATDGDVVTLTPEELEEMGISVDGLQEVTPEEGEAATEGAAKEAGEGEAAEAEAESDAQDAESAQ